jgi:hypothetical protein
VTPTFILIEILDFLGARKIVRPGHTALQTIISEALTAERRRLGQLIEDSVDADARTALQSLLIREEALSQLAALKQPDVQADRMANASLSRFRGYRHLTSSPMACSMRGAAQAVAPGLIGCWNPRKAPKQ